MSGERRVWTREETMLAFELYCTIPSGKVTVYNPQVIELASALDRTPGSVKLKLQNFKSCDPSYTQDGRIGLSNVSKLDRAICLEFLSNWDDLVVEANDIKAQYGLPTLEEIEQDETSLPIGQNRARTRNERIGQAFFRRALLGEYNKRCCFTGIDVPELLRASHIKPWAESNDKDEKANPRNGLLLNALHDAAFDKGYMTITFDYKIVVPHFLLSENEANKRYFAPLNGRNMILPSRYLPDRRFIEYHHSKFKGNNIWQR